MWMSDMTHVVRPATLDDVDAVTAMVTEAFADDPAWRYMTGLGNPMARRALARALMLPRVARGTVWVTSDLTAVAMWDRMDTDFAPSEESTRAWAEYRAEVGEDLWSRLEAYDGACDAHAPERPYWYLGVLATHPDAQGRGLATAVLEPGFAAAADDGWDCWLETSVPGNKAFYAGRGFLPVRDIHVPDGPPTWWLRRASVG
jgi:GNAT superfamily N-acetyltransferase